MWKAMETKAGKIRVGKAEGEREERGKGKEMREERMEKEGKGKTQKKENNESEEDNRRMKNLR